MRPAAPARLSTGKLCHTDQLPPVSISPHFGSVSTSTIFTLLQSASNSSATMRASAVPTCCPNSARIMLTVTAPLRSMPYQIVGSNSSPALRCPSDPEARNSTAARPDRAYPSMTPAPIIAIRKPRREGWYVVLIPCGDNLSTGRSSSHPLCRELDSLADAHVGHASTETP